MLFKFVLPAAALALGLSACNKDQGDEGAGAGTTLTAEAIHSNDVTAIDAVTGEAANMAADVEISDALSNSADSGEDDKSATANKRPGSKLRAKPTEAAPAQTDSAEPAAEAPTNSAQ